MNFDSDVHVFQNDGVNNCDESVWKLILAKTNNPSSSITNEELEIFGPDGRKKILCVKKSSPCGKFKRFMVQEMSLRKNQAFDPRLQYIMGLHEAPLLSFEYVFFVGRNRNVNDYVRCFFCVVHRREVFKLKNIFINHVYAVFNNSGDGAMFFGDSWKCYLKIDWFNVFSIFGAIHYVAFG